MKLPVNWVNSKYNTFTPLGKQKAAKSFNRISNLFPGGYLKSICKTKGGNPKKKNKKKKDKASVYQKKRKHNVLTYNKHTRKGRTRDPRHMYNNSLEAVPLNQLKQTNKNLNWQKPSHVCHILQTIKCPKQGNLAMVKHPVKSNSLNV